MRGVVRRLKAQLLAGLRCHLQNFWHGDVTLVGKRLVFKRVGKSGQRRPCHVSACVVKLRCEYCK